MSSPIIEYRLRHGLTQAQLAGQIGLSQNTISQYEKGRRKPRTTIALKIAKAIGCSVDALYGREPPGGVGEERDASQKDVSQMEINPNAVICAARHYIAAHESAVHDIPVDFGATCAECQLFQSCKGRWLETAAPIFEATNLHPNMFT